MSKVMAISAAVAAASLLSACGSTYTPKSGEPVARLRVVTSPEPKYAADGNWASWLAVNDLSTCPASSTPVIGSGVITAQNAQRLGMPSPTDPSKLSAEFTLPAGRPLALSFGLGEGRWHCQVDLRFTPVAGRDYEVQYAKSADKKMCVTPLFEMKASSAGVQRVRVPGVIRSDNERRCDAGRPAKK